MDITEVKVFPINEEKLKAFVSVVFDGCFMVNDIKVIRGRDGLFISMPSRKKKNGEFKDVAHPLNNDTRRRIETQVLGEYERVLAEREAAGTLTPPAVREAAPPAPAEPAPAEPAAVAAVPVVPAVPVVAEAPPVIGAAAPPADGNAAAGGEDAPAPAAPAAGEAPAAAVEPAAEAKTLEEVEEIHLSDSFWTVT
jgi:stage V sporulation protein G